MPARRNISITISLMMPVTPPRLSGRLNGASFSVSSQTGSAAALAGQASASAAATIVLSQAATLVTAHPLIATAQA